jgi:DNA-binding winged helix-turn-helix (wHTH) protein
LIAARQAIDEVLATLEGLGSELDPSDFATKAAGGEMSRIEAPFLLSHNAESGGYQMGNRFVHLTDLERAILDLLWRSAPTPLQRDFIADSLRARPGSVEVSVSRIRQKLYLLSNGHSHIESLRGRGWVLRPSACNIPTEPGDALGQSLIQTATTPALVPQIEIVG